MANALIDRVSFEMCRYNLENHVNGTFFIQDGYTSEVIREGLTAADEPLDIVDELNARAAIAAMREPTEEMIDAGYVDEFAHHEVPPITVWRAMVDAALAE